MNLNQGSSAPRPHGEHTQISVSNKCRYCQKDDRTGDIIQINAQCRRPSKLD